MSRVNFAACDAAEQAREAAYIEASDARNEAIERAENIYQAAGNVEHVSLDRYEQAETKAASARDDAFIAANDAFITAVVAANTACAASCATPVTE